MPGQAHCATHTEALCCPRRQARPQLPPHRADTSHSPTCRRWQDADLSGQREGPKPLPPIPKPRHFRKQDSYTHGRHQLEQIFYPD